MKKTHVQNKKKKVPYKLEPKKSKNGTNYALVWRSVGVLGFSVLVDIRHFAAVIILDFSVGVDKWYTTTVSHPKKCSHLRKKKDSLKLSNEKEKKKEFF